MALATAASSPALFEVLDEPARLLVADDDPILREFAAVHLVSPQVSVDMAENGREALEKLRAAPFDLALVDLDMPVLDGFALIEFVRADPVLRFLPIVVITGREDMTAIDRAFLAGATSFVAKPLNWRLLSYQLRYVLRASRQENEVRAAKARVEQALTFKANVLRLVQHELRTPLTSIIGFAEQIEQNPRGGSVPEFARHIHTAGKAFATQIADLVSAAEILTQSVTLRLDECRVSQIGAGALRGEADFARRRGIEIRLRDFTKDAQVVCDRALMVQALGHLVRNAIQHGAPPVELLLTRERDGAISFVVRDRGDGVPPDRLTACFEPFQQIDGALTRGGGGIGLGLSVAKRILEAHGGDIILERAPDVGSLAIARLPIAAQA